ncbi:MAG: hypothetical protein HC853_10335, partial [Anaerolineae bacterium]|nr:hypothetical protein [Anaerolineae bacterium]
PPLRGTIRSGRARSCLLRRTIFDRRLRSPASSLAPDRSSTASLWSSSSMYGCAWICTTTPCWLRGSDQVLDTCRRKLGIDVGETTPDGTITLNVVMCIAACHRAPCAQVDWAYHYDLDEAKFDALVSELRAS